jgi:tRNA nucleotidyltransferase (CCA-adding enzyme)
MTDRLDTDSAPESQTDWQAWLERRLPPARRELLLRVGETAVRFGLPVYLVGGFVRDVLLGLEPNDFDLVVEGAAPQLARALGREIGGEVTTHAPFGTATWLVPEGWVTPPSAEAQESWAIDFATARTETYARPAALPEVQPADLNADLRRRDITINAMALRLGPGGGLCDPFHGRADLAARLIRVLHAGSFRDDPTRLFRAVRYEQRLGFWIEPETLAWMGGAWEALDALSADRLRHEFELIFREPRADAMLRRLAQLDILRHVHAALRWDKFQATAAEEISRLPLAEWKLAAPLELDALYLTLMLAEAAPAEVEAALARLNVNRLTADAVRAASGLALAGEKPSQVAAQLDGWTEAALAAAYVRHAAWRGPLHHYLVQGRWVRPALTGTDLIALGLTPGPLFREILQVVRAARLDGQVTDVEGERGLVREMLRSKPNYDR